MPIPACNIRAVCLASLLLLGAIGAPAHAANDDDPYAATRAIFLLAYAAIESGAPVPSAAEPAELRSYPLYPYLERARIMRALRKTEAGKPAAAETRVDEQAAAFLAAHAGEPVAADLRRAWLRNLAARSQWATFVARFDTAVADERLQCQLLAARIELGDTTGLQEAVVEQWLTPQRLPPECEAPFAWLRAQNALADALVEQRVRLLLNNGQAEFARIVARRLPDARAAPLLRWADLLDRPTATLDAALADPKRARELAGAPLLGGWRKLTRSDPSAALARYERLVDVVDDNGETKSQYALALALGLAWDRRATESLEVFRDVAAADLDDYALGWQARAALWARDWRQVQHSIAALSPDERAHARWRYWSARAAEERGDAQAARDAYAALLPNDNYYAANAAARLGRAAEPHPEPLAKDSAQIVAIQALPALVRARELLLCGLRGPAVREWLHGFAELGEQERTQAVHLASSWQWHDVSVSMATRQKIFFDYTLLYPRPYDAEVGTAAELAKLDSRLLYAMIRQESLFRADAVSAAGAMGLAQLLPETAARTARAWQQPSPIAADLLDPAVNVKLGAWHMRDLIDEFDRQTPVALAGYNAGQAAAARWLPAEPIDADIWVENIPYNETRDYVQRVLWHSVVFGWLQTDHAQDVQEWLRPIAPVPTVAGRD
jgi:peptidoglycan lytic transglycosylase